MLLARFDGFVGHVAVGAGVVWVGAVVAVDGHDAVALVRVEGAQGLVDGNLLVVDAQAVAVGVGVAEKAGLQDWVGRGLDAGDHVRGREGNLFNFGKVVFWVLIEDEFAKGAQRYLALWPDFCEVENVPAKFLGLFGREHLDVAGPGGGVSVLNGVEKVLRVTVRVFGGHSASFAVCEGLAALVSFAVDLDVVEGAVGLGEFVCVARVAVHVAVRVRGAAVREEVHDLMRGFLVGGEVIPEHGGLRMNMVRLR